MSDTTHDHRRAVALFRYSVIAEALSAPPGSPERRRLLRAKAEREHEIPGSRRRRVALETMRDWIAHYERGGFDALYPKLRADRGRARQLPPQVAELLVEIKERAPQLSVREVIRQARAQVPPEVSLAPASIYRLFRREGLLQSAPEAAAGKDRRRFSYQRGGEMWMSDVLHGPKVGCDGSDRRRRAKSYLIAFLDDATRLVPHAAFTLSENAATFLPVFKQALRKRGLPTRLYVDNGSNYRCQHLAVICATLGIQLIHARPRQPQGKGKIERFFRTCRAQLLPSLSAADTASLDALNARLAAWVEGEYHLSPHRGLDGDSPLQRWARDAANIRQIAPQTDLDTLFRFRLKRRVNKDRTVSLNATLYEVEAALVGENITLLHDPSLPRARPIPVLHNGRPAGQATLLDAYANTRVRRTRGLPMPHISTLDNATVVVACLKHARPALHCQDSLHRTGRGDPAGAAGTDRQRQPERIRPPRLPRIRLPRQSRPAAGGQLPQSLAPPASAGSHRVAAAAPWRPRRPLPPAPAAPAAARPAGRPR